MPLLISVTLLWAFSFSLIGVYLAGQVDSYFSVFSRVLLAALVFLPLLRWRGTNARSALTLMSIGAVQLGLMYLFYYQSFLLLSVPEVLLFTIFTPFYIALLYDLLARRFSPWNFFVAALAVLGAAVIRWDSANGPSAPNGPSGDYWRGFLVVQAANLCFAFGQVAYKQFMRRQPALPARQTFGWFFLGAALVATFAWLWLGKPDYPETPLQWTILLWLGLVASGLGYFLWNKGATQVSPGTLAVMNNALIPAGLLVNLLIWNRDANIARLAIGGAIILAAVLINELLNERHRLPRKKT
jgi:carboxylate/amino acid/amine transporter